MPKITKTRVFIGAFIAWDLYVNIRNERTIAANLAGLNKMIFHYNALCESVDKHVPDEYKAPIVEDMSFALLADDYGDIPSALIAESLSQENQ